MSVYGQRHRGYGVTPEMLYMMGESFIVSFQSVLEEEWNREVQDAWQQLFRYTDTLTMKGQIIGSSTNKKYKQIFDSVILDSKI